MMSACHPESRRSRREGPYVGRQLTMQWTGMPMPRAVGGFHSTAGFADGSRRVARTATAVLTMTWIMNP